MKIKIETICAINDNLKDYLIWNSALEDFNNTNPKFVLTHALVSSSANKIEDIDNTKIIKTHRNSFWAESILLGIDKLKEDTDFVLIFNHDSIPNPVGIRDAFEKLTEKPDLVIGPIVNSESKEVIFGAVREKFFLKFEVIENDVNAKQAVCSHGNFLCVSKKALEEMKIPSFSHAFLDFFISSQIIRSQKKWYLSSPHVCETNEDREFRKVKLKSSNSLFKPSRSNLKDVFNFYRVYKNTPIALIICIYLFCKSTFIKNQH